MDKDDNHLIKILQSYLRRANYNVNGNDFQLQLVSNPSFPSIKSITDTLDYFGVENIAANVPKNALEQLPRIFLAVINETASTTIAQVTRSKNGVKLLKDDGTKEKLSQEGFIEKWTGTIVAIETDNVKKSQPTLSINNPLIPLLLLVTGAIIFSAISLEWSGLIYASLSALGCLISYYIVQEDLGIYNETTSKICNSASANTSCSDVVNSKSRLFEAISLSDLSITFFVSTLIILSLIGYNESFFFGLAVASIPIIFYSIYIQAFSLKKWCPLCLGIAGVMVGMVTTSLLTTDTFSYNAAYFIEGLVVFGIVYSSWLYLKSLIEQSYELREVKTDFLKFKRNEELFGTMLTKQMLPGILDLNENAKITFGNPDAALSLLAVTSPSCGYCTDSFNVYDQLLKTHGEHFKLTMIFNVNVAAVDNPGLLVSQVIVEMYQESPNKAYKALQEWYSHKDLDKWQSTYGISSDEPAMDILKHQLDWCKANDIKGTPTNIIENYFFPSAYDIEDLPLFMDGLIENRDTLLKVQAPVVD